jgi:hypothetical protein
MGLMRLENYAQKQMVQVYGENLLKLMREGLNQRDSNTGAFLKFGIRFKLTKNYGFQ